MRTFPANAPTDLRDEASPHPSEAEDVIRAISDGEIDAFVISPNDEPQVVTLASADWAYRVLTDKMAQGAVTVAPDSTILYANRPFAALLGVSVHALSGTALSELVHDGDVPLLEAVLARAGAGAVSTELVFKRDSAPFPAHVDAETLFENASAICLLVTDLSEQRKHEAVMAAEALGRSILDQALDAIVVCDLRGAIVRASKSSYALCGCNPLLQPFAAMFPLSGNSEALDLEAIQRGQVLRDAAFEMALSGRQVSLLVNAGPVVDAAGETVACVITLTDITHLKRIEIDLKEADAKKDEMLAVVAHELRNPLATISMVGDVLGRGVVNAADLASLCDRLKRGVDHIARLVEDLTDFNRIRLHKLSLHLEHVDMRRVVESAAESVRPALAARLQKLEVRVPGSAVMIHADESRLSQVLTNLLNNANKFTPDDGQVQVRLEVDDASRQAVVSVRDSGKGIPEAMRTKIFEAFEQSPGSERQGGLGIGLALARRIVELHRGSIDADSAGPGTGATFTVRLPLDSPSRSIS